MENLSVTEQLNAMIGHFVNQHECKAIFKLKFLKFLNLASLNINAELNKKSTKEKSIDNYKAGSAEMALITAIEKCKKADQTDKLVEYRAEMKKDARDLAMAMLMETDGHLLVKDSFKVNYFIKKQLKIKN